MAIDVVVGVGNDEISEDLVRITWEAAQRIFRKYGLEVYVIPVVIGSRVPYILINGVKVQIKSPPSSEEIEDLILSVAMYAEGEEEDVEIFGSLEDPILADAVFYF